MEKEYTYDTKPTYGRLSNGSIKADKIMADSFFYGEYGMTKQLFRIKDTEDFGTVIATDSKGMKIFELKAGGIKVVKAEDIEEVFPFTFSTTFGKDQEYHFLGKEGEVKVGDLLVYLGGNFNIGICRVVAVDTKSRSATETFSGYKLEAAKLN